jgi:tetrahydromethanopterin S-methyltransferase subunit B
MINQFQQGWREAKTRNLIKGMVIGLRFACLFALLSLIGYLMLG